MNYRLLQRLQNSFFTSWIWRMTRNEKTGEITLTPFWIVFYINIKKYLTRQPNNLADDEEEGMI